MKDSVTGVETLPKIADSHFIKRIRVLRRVGLAALVAFVVAGAVGLLGVRTSTATASGGGYTVTFDYPGIARAGWAVPWQLRIQHDGGFGEESITVAITGDYFELYESQRFWPEPSSETRNDDFIFLTFDPPPGDTLVIDFDAFIQPSAQRGRDAELVVIAEGERQVSVNVSTFLLP